MHFLVCLSVKRATCFVSLQTKAQGIKACKANPDCSACPASNGAFFCGPKVPDANSCSLRIDDIIVKFGTQGAEDCYCLEMV